MPPKRKAAIEKNLQEIQDNIDEDVESGGDATVPKLRVRGTRVKKVIKTDLREDDEITAAIQKKGAKKGRVKKLKPVKNEEESDSPSETASEELKEKPKKVSRAKKVSKVDHKEDVEVEETAHKKGTKKGRINEIKSEENEEEESPSETAPKEPQGKPKKITRVKKTKPEMNEEELDSPSETAPEEPKEKPKKVSRAKKSKTEDMQANGKELVEKKAAKRDRTKGAKEDADVPKKKNATSSKWEIIDFSCNKKNEEGNTFNLKISSWNIGGIKSWIKKECLQFIEHEKPDIFCIQETKCNETNLPEEMEDLKDYKQYWCSSEKLGYAGVGLLTKIEPLEVIYGIGNDEMDSDGRCITAEYENYFVLSLYVPNAGRGLVTLPKRLKWNDLFKEFINNLNKKKPVIICGDMNVSHKEIDLARPKNNTKNAGFTPEEREGMTDFLAAGYVDSFRALYPDRENAYTFWTYMSNARAKNVGWRLDYFIVSERLMKKICDNVIRSEIAGSDHCPITLFLNI